MLLDLSRFPNPYILTAVGDSYTFSTDNGNEYLINFKDSTPDYADFDIGAAVIYEYQFYRTVSISSDADSRVSETILHSVANAMITNNVVIYFICDGQDERELMRHKLFDTWYRRYGKEQFLKLDTEIPYENRVEYSSILIHRQNSDIDKLVNVFDEIREYLKGKIEE